MVLAHVVAPNLFGNIDAVVAPFTVDLEPRNIGVWVDPLVVDNGPINTTPEGWDGGEAIGAVTGSLSVAVLMGTERGGEIRGRLEKHLHGFEVLCVVGAEGLVLLFLVNRHRRWRRVVSIIAVAPGQVDYLSRFTDERPPTQKPPHL